MKRIGILRGIFPRDSQKEFAQSFTKLKAVFLSEKNLGRQNIYLVDPVRLLLGRTAHQSWVGVNSQNLLKVCKNLVFLETYELYHFFSGQAADVSEKLNIPLIAEVWTSFNHPAYFTPPYSWTVKKVIGQTSLFVARSNMAKKSLLKLGIPKEKIMVLYHGVNTEKFKPLINHQSPTTNHQPPRTFLFVGELEKYKGVEVILKAWEIYHRSHPKDTLLMAGNGSMAGMAKTAKGIKYLGYVKHDKLPEVYRKADVFVSPSIDRYLGPIKWWEEFFSYTLMEAMASGLSIIATESGGIPEEVPKGLGNIIIPQNDVQSLVSAMEKIRLSNNNRNYALKHYNLYRNTEKLEDLIQTLHL